MSHHEDDKKKKIRERNKRNWMIFSLAREQLDKVDVGAAVVERKGGDKEAKKGDEAITMHVAMIKNRLTGKRKEANERWNRFAGTSGGGGRGR